MKKFFLCALICALALSLCSLSAVAEIDLSAWGLSYTPGCFAGESGDAFSPVGDVRVPWDPDVAAKTDMSDGDVSDWKALGCTPVTIGENQMVSWVGGEKGVRDPGMPADWGIEFYFMADADYLYLIFDVTDSDFVYGDDAGPYNGDAIQLSIDLGARLEETLEYNPDDLVNPKGIFYSFACQGDGAPVQIMRQESDNDGVISEANGDGVKGAAKKTDNGWSAEFALSWEQLYEDYSWKSWDDKNIYVGGDKDLPLYIGCCLYYLDRSETSGGIHWAAGSSNGVADDNGTPQVSWTAYDNGLNLSLAYQDGMEFKCDGIVALPKTETIPVETDAPETEAPETTAAPETEAPAPETQAPAADTQAPAADTQAPAETQAPADKGCGGIVGFGAAAILAAAAAAVVLKKKD